MHRPRSTLCSGSKTPSRHLQLHLLLQSGHRLRVLAIKPPRYLVSRGPPLATPSNTDEHITDTCISSSGHDHPGTDTTGSRPPELAIFVGVFVGTSTLSHRRCIRTKPCSSGHPSQSSFCIIIMQRRAVAVRTSIVRIYSAILITTFPK